MNSIRILKQSPMYISPNQDFYFIGRFFKILLGSPMQYLKLLQPIDITLWHKHGHTKIGVYTYRGCDPEIPTGRERTSSESEVETDQGSSEIRKIFI